MRVLKDYILLALKGGAMGAADVVPGVSGGTIAFITGIYEELLNSIKSVNSTALKLLFRFQFKELWSHINGNFLLAVMLGVGVSIMSLAKLMTMLLTQYPIFIWSFFFGLIIASSVMVGREVKRWRAAQLISLVAGAFIAYWITIATPATTSDEWWFISLSGAIAICAMILPGISGSFILLLMGKYMFIMDAISTLNIRVIALFGCGAVVGIVSFSHLLSWLLKRFHSVTIALLTGFMIGSLNKVWPWKEVVSTYTDRHGEVKPLVESNILPSTFESITANDSQLGAAIAMSLFGLALIFTVEAIGKKLSK